MDEFALTPDYELDLSGLTRPVGSVAPDFTLLDLVRIVFEGERRWPGIAAAFDMGKIDAFYAEASGERDGDDEDDLHYLELYWAFDHDAETIPEARRWNRRRPKGRRRIPDVREIPDRGTMPNLMSFHGIGQHWTDTECAEREHCGHHRQYGIWLTPLNNLAHLPIKVDTGAKIYRPPLREMRHPVRRLAQRLGRLGRPLLARWDRRLEILVMTIEIQPTLHIEPSIGLAWDGRLRPQEATAVADALEGPVSAGSSVRMGLESVAVRRMASGAEIEVTGVMVHSEISVKLDASQVARLAAVLRPPVPPPPVWSHGADRRRDDGMRRIFG